MAVQFPDLPRPNGRLSELIKAGRLATDRTVQHVAHALELRDEPVWILSLTHPGYLNPWRCSPVSPHLSRRK